MRLGRIVRLVLIPILFALTVTVVVAKMAPAAEPEASEPLVPVLVAAADIPARTVLTASVLAIKEVPVSLAPDGALSGVAEAVGLVTVTPVYAGEVIIGSRIAGDSPSDGLAYQLQPGQRAVAVRIDEWIGVGGHLRPGDRVDLLWTGKDPVGDQETTSIVLADVAVLAIALNTSPYPAGDGAEERQYTSATLAVTPAQAASLVLSEETGVIRLALRPAVADSARASAVAVPVDLVRGRAVQGAEPVRLSVSVCEMDSPASLELFGPTDRVRLVTARADIMARIQALLAQERARLIDGGELSIEQGDWGQYVLAGEDATGRERGLWLTLGVTSAEHAIGLDMELTLRAVVAEGTVLRTTREIARLTGDDSLVICGITPAHDTGWAGVWPAGTVSDGSEVFIMIQRVKD